MYVCDLFAAFVCFFFNAFLSNSLLLTGGVTCESQPLPNTKYGGNPSRIGNGVTKVWRKWGSVRALMVKEGSACVLWVFAIQIGNVMY